LVTRRHQPFENRPIPHLAFVAMQVREFVEGQEIDQVLLVRERELRTRRDGSELLRLTLADRSGAVTAIAPPGFAGAAAPGGCVRVAGRYELHPRLGAQLALRDLRLADPGEYEPADLLDGPARAVDALEADLRELVATVQDPHLRALLDALLGSESATWPRYRDAPAAKRYHQAYRHGLLEHSVGVAQAVSAISATFGGIDRDVAVTGALLHDIGKLDAYTADPVAIDLTDLGRLQGEIPLGYYRVRRAIEDLHGFPAHLAAAVLHIILSHHGQLEHGSPVVPCTREATLVHMVDNLGGRLGSFDRLEKTLADGATWSGYDRALGAGAWFAARRAA
jgi:3'-5' exoribonuclease